MNRFALRQRQIPRRAAAGLIAVLAATASWPATPAAAQSAEQDIAKLPSLQAELAAAQRDEADMLATIEKAVAAARALLDQHQSLADAARSLSLEGEALQRDLDTQAASAAKQREAAAQHNSQCPHETGDAALAATCNEDMTRLNTWANRIKAESDRLEATKQQHNKKVADIEAKDRALLAQLTQLQTSDAAERERLATLRARLASLRTALAGARAHCATLGKTGPAMPESGVAQACRTAFPDAPASQAPPEAPK
jgi:chromosome segregation ATPase